MRRLAAAALVLGLFGCPNWDAERIAQCREIGSTTGVCEGLGDAGAGGGVGGGGVGGGGVGGGGVGGGGVGGGGVGGGGVIGFLDGGIDTLPAFPAITVLHSNPGGGQLRTPVLVWQLPGTTKALTVESSTNNVLLWVENTNFSTGNFPLSWSGSAVREGSSILGTAVTSGPSVITADTFTAGSKTESRDFPIDDQPAALAQIVFDGGPGFLAASRSPTTIKFERSTCAVSCAQLDITVPQKNDAVFEAVADQAGTSWVAARIERDAGPELVVYAVPGDLSVPVVYALDRDAGMSSKVELSSSGSQVHAVWLPNPLELVIATPGGSRSRFALPEPARLVDVMENGTVGVVVLEFSNHRTVVLLYAGSNFSFHRVAGLAIAFQPLVAHLGTKLRLAGYCIGLDGGPFGDASANCAGPSRNPIVEFPLRPDGTAW